MWMLLGLLMALALSGNLAAQEEDPGYVDFDTLDLPFDG